MSQITLISECFVRPKSQVQDSQKYYYFPSPGLRFLSIGNSQYGLIFSETSYWPSKSNIFNKLKDSLSQALVYFYPLAGRLVTQKHQQEHSCSIFVDCTKGPGARLIHASAPGLTVSDVSDTCKDVPVVVQSFFDLGERQVNHDAHTRALLSLQLTELEDGLFIGCSINHCLADAISVTVFLNVISQIFVGVNISYIPVFEPSMPLSDINQSIKLPYLDAVEFINRFNEGNLRDRIFHFSSESLKRLKAKANTEASQNNSNVTLSSFKALCGHLWMSITRARKALSSEETSFSIGINLRSRLNPPLSPNFIGNFAAGMKVTAKVGELLTKGLGWVTMMIHLKVEELNDEVIREMFFKNIKTLVNLGSMSGSANCVIIGGSPWLNLYEADFGLGKPVAARTGYTNRLSGKIVALPSKLGFGNVDVQISLLPEIMSQLLLDEEFLKYVVS